MLLIGSIVSFRRGAPFWSGRICPRFCECNFLYNHYAPRALFALRFLSSFRCVKRAAAELTTRHRDNLYLNEGRGTGREGTQREKRGCAEIVLRPDPGSRQRQQATSNCD